MISNAFTPENVLQDYHTNSFYIISKEKVIVKITDHANGGRYFWVNSV